jgi:hypothetical protein
MKRLISFVLGAAVVIGVAVLFVVFAHHNGPGESPRDDNNTKTEPAAAAPFPGSAGISARV